MATDTDEIVDLPIEGEKTIVDESAKAEQPEASTGHDEPKDTSSIVRDVVDARKKDQPEAASSADESEEDKGTEPESEARDEDEEEYSTVPFNQHPRFRKLIGEKKALKTEVAALKPDAERYRNVQTFIDQQGVTAEEAAELLVIGGLIKTNPKEAWERVKPTIQKLLVAAGEVLPDDLRQRVDQGEMPRDIALEVSRARALVASREVAERHVREDTERRQAENMQQSLQAAAATWQSSRQSRDPNFDAKLPAIMKEVVWLQSQGERPNTPEGVKAQLDKAYKAVTASSAPAVTVKPITPVVGGQVSGKHVPEAQTTLDIVKNVMARRAAG